MFRKLNRLPLAAAFLLLTVALTADAKPPKPKISVAIDFAEAQHFQGLLGSSAPDVTTGVAVAIVKDLTKRLPVFEFTTVAGPGTHNLSFAFCEQDAGWPYSNVTVTTCSNGNCTDDEVLPARPGKPSGFQWLGKVTADFVVAKQDSVFDSVPFPTRINLPDPGHVTTKLAYADVDLRPGAAVFKLVTPNKGDLVFLACATPMIGGPFLREAPERAPTLCRGETLPEVAGRSWQQMFLYRMWQR